MICLALNWLAMNGMEMIGLAMIGLAMIELKNHLFCNYRADNEWAGNV